MLHEILPVGPLQCNCQILGDEASKKALVVDPGDDIDRVEAVLARHELTIDKLVFTHAHIDHIGQAARLKRSTGAPTYLHALEGPVLASLPQQAAWLNTAPPELVEIDHELREGRDLDFCGRRIEVLFTPGHSPGSVSLLLREEKKVLAGDVLFAGSVGRTDLPGGDMDTLMRSIREELLPLPDEFEVFPGHGPSTTIGRERVMNPFLQGMG